MKKTLQIFYLSIGFLCFGLGALGALVPVLPTTPFLLVASFCFARGSRRFDAWFRATALYRKHLEYFVQTKTMSAKSKAILLSSVTLLLLIPFVLVDILWVRLVIAGVILVKYYYFLFRIKTGARPQVATEKNNE